MAPEERAGSTRRKMYARKTAVAALISDMRKLEQIILLENELVKPSDYTPYIRQEAPDAIARGAPPRAIRRGGGAPFWLSLGPKIGIIRAIHTVLGDPTNSHKTVQILYKEKPLTSLALHGFPAVAAGEGKFIFTVAVLASGGEEFDAIVQIIDLMSGMRKSQKVLSKETVSILTDHPIQISLLKPQSPIRPVASDWDLVCFPDRQAT
ncbi:hypothetical protein BDZ94DRAFT_1270937 [Collybia nuda]|uniref:Uncharacterized protein n=1 Tax=Collybia nuda TaxID=64659 RepID=A0A9P5XXB5_9AGAR|nr:hypothetical protein BDZ94DRAFT_1270937 [Collybia nuda]